MDVCKDEKVVIACNLIFACTLRPGEVTGLTWDCMDISPEAIEEDRAYIIINKELQRVTKEALKALDGSLQRAFHQWKYRKSLRSRKMYL